MYVSSVQFLSHVWPHATPWATACHASLSITKSQSWLKFMSIQSVMLSNHLIFCHPFLLLPSIFPTISVFSNELVLSIRWPKYWSEAQHQSFQWIFKTYLQDWLVWSPCSPRDSQESSPTAQFKSINSSALSFLYGPILTSIHDYWKKHPLTRWTFFDKVMPLLFHMLSSLVIASLLRSKHLFTSWLRSPSAVIWGPQK